MEYLFKVKDKIEPLKNPTVTMSFHLKLSDQDNLKNELRNWPFLLLSSDIS